MGEGRILVQATVTAVSDDHFLYPCCVQCYSKLLEDVQQNRWHCVKCGEAYMKEDMEWRYRLRLTIADTNEYRQVAVFGRTVQPFFGASANTFHRFLCHLQQTECDLADVVLKQAVDMVFIGQLFLFGFASVARHRTSMTVSCLSHVAKTKGSNSDLIAVQMISPDPTHMTTVSQQMSSLCREILSNSIHQVSLDEKTSNTSRSAESKLTQRQNSCQDPPNIFNSVLELSGNSVHSLVSVLFSCENSLAKNSTGSPSSLSATNFGLDPDATESGTTNCNEHDEGSLHGQSPSDTSPGKSAAENPELEEEDFEETLNDSSLLLADRDTCLQELGERSMSYQIHHDSHNGDMESQDTLLSSSKHLIINRDDADMAVETENVWEDMPYSEDLDEFLFKANDCERNSEHFVSVTDDHKKFQNSLRKTNKVSLVGKRETCDAIVSDSDKAGSETRPMNVLTESIECPRCDVLEYSAQYCPDFSFKVKDQNDMDETCGYYRQKTLNTLCEMPESESLDEFLSLAAGSTAVPKTDTIKVSENGYLLPDQNVKYKRDISLDTTTKTLAEPESRKVNPSQEQEPWKEIQNFGDVSLKGNSSVADKYECQSERNVMVMDVPSVPEADLDKYFEDSFSESDCDQGSVTLSCPCVNSEHETSSNIQVFYASTFDEASSSRNINHFSKDTNSRTETKVLQKHFAKDEIMNSGHEDSMVSLNETRVGMSSELEPQLYKEGKDEAATRITENIETENPKEGLVPGHLFHSVGSVGSLNGSLELFDASCDLFEEEQEDFVMTECNKSCLGQLSAVCESINDSRLNLPSPCSTKFKTKALDSQKKSVKFAKRLSHVSSVQLIDIRMKLNFGIPVESQSSPAKPCLRIKDFETIQSPFKRPSVYYKPQLNPSQSDIVCPQEHSIRADNNGDQNADFPMSQDLFACSEGLDYSQSPCPADIAVERKIPGDVTEQTGRQADSLPSDMLLAPREVFDIGLDFKSRPMSKTSLGAADDLADDPANDLICSPFTIGLQNKELVRETSTDERKCVDTDPGILDATQDSILTPADGSQILFSQTENTCPRTRISSTPTVDSDPGDILLLSLTPDLFSP